MAQQAAVDHQRLAGDVGRVGGGKERDRGGHLLRLVVFFYGLTTQTTVVAVVSVVGVALAFALGAFVVWRASPSSPFSEEFEERRQSDRMAETDEPEAVASQEA